ncbi:MAG TPA: tetratricopeptide repeat protein [Longimicrobium sp.]|nr:tetratricopeptide repeat protein [Longimicrobium sp.]
MKPMMKRIKDLAVTLGIVVGIIGPIQFFWRFTQDLRSDNSLIYFCTAVTLLLLWWTAVREAVAVTHSDVLSHTGKAFSRYKHKGWKRFLLLTTLICIPSALLGSFFLLQQRPAELIILVADLDGPDNSFGVTQSIIEGLRALEADDSRIKVVSADTVITAQDGSTVARRLGHDRGAALVVWGWYRHTDARATITIHYETFHDPCWLKLSRSSATRVGPAKQLSCFTLQSDVSAEVNAVAAVSAGILYYSEKDYGRAAAYLDVAIRDAHAAPMISDPKTRGRLLEYKAFSEYNLGNFPEAVHAYDASLALNRENAYAFDGRGNALLRVERVSGALASFDTALMLEPSRTVTLLNRGIALRKMQLFARADADFRNVIARQPQNGWGYYHLAESLRLQGRYSQAVDEYDRALAVDDTISKLCAACALSGRGNARLSMFTVGASTDLTVLDRAIADFTAAMRLTDSGGVNRYNRALALYHRGETDRAYREYSKIIADHPSYSSPYRGRARILLDWRRPSSALYDLEAAVAASPQDARIHLLLGEAHLESGRIDEAKIAYASALQYAPDAATRSAAAEGVSRATHFRLPRRLQTSRE